jgi:hypothetical protein
MTHLGTLSDQATQRSVIEYGRRNFYSHVVFGTILGRKKLRYYYYYYYGSTALCWALAALSVS